VSLESVLTRYVSSKLDQLSGRIADCLARLSYDEVWARGTENENAVGNLVLHLCGNVRQWIVSGVGGAPDVRNRDAEFAARGGLEPAELSGRIRSIVCEANGIIGKLPPERMAERVTIQGYELTVAEALLHVLEHFSHHTGQIIFATKLAKGQDLGYYAHLRRPSHGEKIP
jgi:uncharacterized damage-inducible protein DinB